MTDPALDRVRTATGWSIALSILMILVGILAIVLPQTAGAAVVALVGWLLLISGVLHLAFAWRSTRPAGVVWEVLVGIVYILIGYYVLSHPLVGLASLALALAVYLFIEAILEFALGFRLRMLPGSGWVLFDGLVTLVLAVLVWRAWPSGAAWVIGTIVGVSMFVSGISRLALSMGVRRAIA